MEVITGEDGICILSHPGKVLFASEEQATGIVQDGLQIGTDTCLVSSLDVFFSPLKESAFMSSRQDYDAVETESINQRGRQYLGRNRAYLTIFSFVLMRLYFASFVGSLHPTLCSCRAVKSNCENTHMSHMLIRFALNHDRDYSVRTVKAVKLSVFPAAKFTFM